jgi:tRNA U34 5-methylaminomethyl-2-thiouridine-forming methyltransferase MnmC
MIRHCVFISFRPEVSGVEQLGLYNELRALRGHLGGIVDMRSGRNCSPEVGMDHGWSDGFIIDFVDAAARDTYLIDPAHQAIGQRLVEAAVGGVAGIFVFDLDIDIDLDLDTNDSTTGCQ